MDGLTKILFVAIGGAFGAAARYGLSLFFANTLSPFPFATFLINITGSFLVGFVITKFEGNDTLRLLLITGFLGAYTTFSTFEFETFSLTQTKQLAVAFAYVSLSFAIGLIGVFGGVWLGKKI
jgi:fluoride exporter